ncbi:hypothetical protein F5Y09DRAFT_302715 [Xylaria sp. FL1042]|nr:hypothetical protein F5Y09DRAFT_302715 [Xylaria sp. FL1042]
MSWAHKDDGWAFSRLRLRILGRKLFLATLLHSSLCLCQNVSLSIVPAVFNHRSWPGVFFPTHVILAPLACLASVIVLKGDQVCEHTQWCVGGDMPSGCV